MTPTFIFFSLHTTYALEVLLKNDTSIYGLGLRNFFYAFFFPIAPIIIFCFPKYKVQPNLALTLTQKSRDTHIKSLRQQKLAPQIGLKSWYTRK